MSFDLCSVQRAEHPYFIESIATRIYSIEELCWFLHHNLYLIDSSVTSEALMIWVRDELGLKNLARKMADALERPDHDASYFILPIFQEIGYLPAQELRKLREELTRVQIQPEEHRMKTQADYLQKSGRFTASILLYRRIIENRTEGRLGAVFISSVWNNLGCAYARQFRFREAADAFMQGWKAMQSRELLRRYVSCLPLFMSHEEYCRTLEDLGADSVLVNKIQEYNARVEARVQDRLGTRSNPDEDLVKEARELLEDYRRKASF